MLGPVPIPAILGMFTVQKLYAGEYRDIGSFTFLDSAIEYCKQNDKLRDGRVIDKFGDVVFEDIVRKKQQVVINQWGLLGGLFSSFSGTIPEDDEDDDKSDYLDYPINGI